MCNDGNSIIRFNTQVFYSTVTDYVFYPVSDWMPSFEDLRAAIRLLAEQGDGIDISPAIRTATARYDINGAEGLNTWSAVGTAVTQDGDSNPQDINISANVSGEFWLQLGVAVRKGSGANAIGQGQGGIQYNLPTERLVVVAGPVNMDTVTSPVGSAWAELFATEWMSFYELEEVAIPYDVFDGSNFEFEFVLQSVKTDPTQEAPAEDIILSATSANASGTVSATSFTNASSNKAQLCRVVYRARTTGATEGTARAWLAVAVKYA